MPLGLRLRLAVPLFVLSVLGILDFYDWAIPRPQQTRANVDDTCVQPDHALRLQLGLADSVDALMLDTCAPLQPGTYEARLSYLGSSPVQFAVSHELVRGAPGLGLHRRRLLDVEQRRVHVLGAHAVDARFTVAVELNGVWDERLWEMDENDVIEFMFVLESVDLGVVHRRVWKMVVVLLVMIVAALRWAVPVVEEQLAKAEDKEDV